LNKVGGGRDTLITTQSSNHFSITQIKVTYKIGGTCTEEICIKHFIVKWRRKKPFGRSRRIFEKNSRISFYVKGLGSKNRDQTQMAKEYTCGCLLRTR
jgi:hypothetical protein